MLTSRLIDHQKSSSGDSITSASPSVLNMGKTKKGSSKNIFGKGWDAFTQCNTLCHLDIPAAILDLFHAVYWRRLWWRVPTCPWRRRRRCLCWRWRATWPACQRCSDSSRYRESDRQHLTPGLSSELKLSSLDYLVWKRADAVRDTSEASEASVWYHTAAVSRSHCRGRPGQCLPVCSHLINWIGH